MVHCVHGKTKAHRPRAGAESSDRCRASYGSARVASGPGGSFSGFTWNHAGTDGIPARCGARHSAPAASAVSRTVPHGLPCAKTAWRAAERTDERRGRTGVPGALGGAGREWRCVGYICFVGGLGAATGTSRGRFGGIPASGATWLAQGGTGHSSPKERSTNPRGLGKKLPETLGTLLTPEEVQGRGVRLMFQDEARFGRMVRIRRCWSPAPARPTVPNGYEREFVYVYGAVSPLEGEILPGDEHRADGLFPRTSQRGSPG